MGFKPKRTLFKLTFEDPDLEGLEVTVRSVPVGTLAELAGLSVAFTAIDTASPSADDLGKVTDVLRLFAGMLHSWNVEDDDGSPVPATYEGVASLEYQFTIPLITRAVEAITQAPPPLPAGSPSGATSPEAQIPMTPNVPSASPPSLSAPS